MLEQVCDDVIDSVDGSSVGFPQQRLELRDGLLDRVEVWTVGGQEQQQRTGGADRLGDLATLVAAEVVHDDDITGTQCWHQEIGDIGQETTGVDPSVEHARRGDCVATQRSDEGQSLPVAVRHFIDETLTDRASPVRARHVRLDPGFINKDQALWINLVLALLPQLAPAGDVRPIPLAGVQSFLKLRPARSTMFHNGK